jgi:hypothetical protein
MTARSILDRGSHFYRLLLLLLDYSITGPVKDNLYSALSGPRVEGPPKIYSCALSRLSTLRCFSFLAVESGWRNWRRDKRQRVGTSFNFFVHVIIRRPTSNVV